MKSKFALATTLVAILALGLIPARAGSAMVTYVATPGLRISNAAVPVGVGGYAFTTPQAPTSIHVQDLNGSGVFVIVCQENDQPVGDPEDLPNICGDGGDDVDIQFCTTANPRGVGNAGFQATRPFTVFVITADPTCPQPATAGTITVQY